MKLRNSVRIISLMALGVQLQGCAKPGSAETASAQLPSSREAISCEQAMSFNNYFEEVDTATGSNPSTEAGIIRERQVKVDLQSLKADILTGSPVLRLELFKDQVIDLVVEKIKRSKDGSSLIVTGHLKTDPLGSAVISIEKDVVIANINPLQDSHYKIVLKENGVHAIQESDNKEDESENSCMAENSVEAEAHAEDSAQEAASESDENKALAATPVIDMLVAYTPNARIAAGGTTAIKALIQSGIANTNKAMVDSGVNLKVRLVGTLALTQNESSNFSTDLSRLKSKTDGKWDAVHSARTRLGADQVTLVGNYSGNSVAGIGYISAGLTSAFTIVKRSAFSMYTFSHELGHNIGLQHSHGYVNSAGRFRTIMAYGSYPRIIRFSNPNLSFKGYRTGTSSQNSASILNAKGKNIANLVTAVAADEMSDVPVESMPSCLN